MTSGRQEGSSESPSGERDGAEDRFAAPRTELPHRERDDDEPSLGRGGDGPLAGPRGRRPRAPWLLPWMPVRQWVLTVPYRLRYQMAWNHGLSRAVLRVYTRVLLDVYARGARECGGPGGRTGSVTVMQRAGSGLNVNLHFHTLVLDGVFVEAPGEHWRFSRRRHRATT